MLTIKKIQKNIHSIKHFINFFRDPIVTGTSVLGIKFVGGVMICADTLGSYGSLARFRSLERIKKVGDFSVVGASGEFSDFQYISQSLDNLTYF